MALKKPDNIYEPKPSTDVEKIVDGLSFAEMIRLYTRLKEKVELDPVKEEVVPALGDEEVREMVLDEHERKFDTEEEPVEEKPKVSPYAIRFNPPGTEYGKPLGWDKPEKKPSFFQVIWDGIWDTDMDPSDYKRYDNFMSTARPILIILFIMLLAIGAYKFVNASSTPEHAYRSKSFTDKVINWGVEQYERLTDDNNVEYDTIKTTSQPVKIAPIQLTRPIDTPKELLTARDSAINYIP
jgi:hypothetical protein